MPSPSSTRRSGDLHREVFEGVLESGEPDEYELAVSPDPSHPEYYRARLSPIVRNGEVEFVISVATNVTEIHMVSEAREAAEEQVETLRALMPLCAWCRRIRSDEGYWASVEEFVQSETGARLTHAMCPSCEAKMEAEAEAS